MLPLMGPFQVIKEYAPVISHHQSKSLIITKSNTTYDISGLSECMQNVKKLIPGHLRYAMLNIINWTRHFVVSTLLQKVVYLPQGQK